MVLLLPPHLSQQPERMEKSLLAPLPPLVPRKQVRGESQELPPLGAHLAASRIPLLSLLHHLLPRSHDCHVRRRLLLLLLHQEELAG